MSAGALSARPQDAAWLEGGFAGCFWAGRSRSTVGKVPAQPLFDHLVGAGEERGRNFEAERVGGLHVDHQLELGRLRAGPPKLVPEKRSPGQTSPILLPGVSTGFAERKI
jgi:hypothetical protein